MGACAAGIAKTFVILFSLITFILSVAVLAIAGSVPGRHLCGRPHVGPHVVRLPRHRHRALPHLHDGLHGHVLGQDAQVLAHRHHPLHSSSSFAPAVPPPRLRRTPNPHLTHSRPAQASFIVVYLYGDIVSLAAENNFTIPDGQTELAMTGHHLQRGQGGLEQRLRRCAPVVYDTTNLNDNYCTGHDDYCVDGTTNLASDKTYMYCSSPAPTLVYPSADSSSCPRRPSPPRGSAGGEQCLPRRPLHCGDGQRDRRRRLERLLRLLPLVVWTRARSPRAPRCSTGCPRARRSTRAACFCAVSAEGSGLWQRLVAYSTAPSGSRSACASSSSSPSSPSATCSAAARRTSRTTTPTRRQTARRSTCAARELCRASRADVPACHPAWNAPTPHLSRVHKRAWLM